MPEPPLVLLIEDDEDFQVLFGMVAEEAGYRVEYISDGGRALQRLHEEPIPDLMLLDYFLPGANGDVVLAAARSETKWFDVPIYYLTADIRITNNYCQDLIVSQRLNGVIDKGTEVVRQLRDLFSMRANT